MKQKAVGVLLLLSFSAALLLLPSFAEDKEKDIQFVTPKGWPKPAYDFSKNPVTQEGFKLGRKLFFDPLLSKDSSTSCASCHLPFTNYTHVDHAVSHGIKGLKGTRNTLSIINLAWNRSFMWDGGVNNLEVQPLAPIQNPVEMDNTLENIILKLKRSKVYPEKFKEAFGDSAEITGQRVLKALAQYMVSIESYNSKYDKVMRKEKDVAFTGAEKKGLVLFRKNCASCHKEPLFTSDTYENNGLEVDPRYRDGGRIKITRHEKDSLKFRVPSLRNIEVSYPYMHDGRFRNLEMVLFHYTNSVIQSPFLSEKLKKPIVLSEEDKKNMIAFLKTLTDKEFLYDARFREPLK